jgi:2-oxoglutarate dehydrogenase E1 component
MKHSVSARLNVELLDEMYARWSANPDSVDNTWAVFFEGFSLGVAQPPQRAQSSAATSSAPAEQLAPQGEPDFRAKVTSIVENYRRLGHTQAHINPLDGRPETNPRLTPEALGFGEADMEKEAASAFFRSGERMKLRDFFRVMEETYAGSIGFEFMHIHNTAIRHWVRERIENRPRRAPESREQRIKSLQWLMEAEIFETFLGKKFIGEKRFSLEGGEGALVVLNAILESCPSSGVQEIEMGMAHRGRLNVLSNFVQKSLTTILYEFTPNYEPDLVAGDGDVKYHLGYESVRKVGGGEVRVSLAANPSHLEAVNPVVEGKARARQRLIGDDGHITDRKRVLPLLIHGDAAFAGQGSVAEVINLSQLPGYRTGGTIHLVINNQIGFTTMPADARSSAYATDIAKMIEAPILHVNGERPEELWWAAQFALDFRQQFSRDVVIDMYCYRRQGHNETDQAAFTAPLIAKSIASRKPINFLYKQELIDNGTLTQEEADAIEKAIWDKLEAGYQKMVELQEKGDRTAFSGSTAIEQPAYHHAPVPTGVVDATLKHIGEVLTTVPETFHLHPTLEKRFLPRRREAIEKGQNIDWALAESLAWGSLLMEGNPVRLSGQDCRRGTFSQRHAVFYDYENRERYFPLKHLSENQARFCVYNSLLSEFAVLGFDYGYSLGAPNMLTMWEAQFGDFSNGAQVIIDQFIASAESKWQTPSDIVLLLPHGYEGQGPEHSSARLERFLQLCADDNMIVGNFTTPAQYFHALRRQKRREFRKPLILMTPKSLLTRAEAVSSLADFLPGTCFQEILPDTAAHNNASAIQRVIFCSGKVFYDLDAYRKEHQIHDTAIIRVEQLYPFHHELARLFVSEFTNASQFVWCQEEPQNMGAWTYIAPRLRQVVGRDLAYAGREEAASPAAGSKAMHYRETKALLQSAFSI